MTKDVPVMTGEWVDKVWEKSKHENVHAIGKKHAFNSSNPTRVIHSRNRKNWVQNFHVTFLTSDHVFIIVLV